MCRWQAIFLQESWWISRKNCAVQGAKDPLIGHVDMFQTSPKTHAIISRISAPTTLLVRPSKKSSAQVQRRRQSQENCNHVVSPQFPPVSDIFSSILRDCRPVDLLLPFINAVAVNPQSQCLRRGDGTGDILDKICDFGTDARGAAWRKTDRNSESSLTVMLTMMRFSSSRSKGPFKCCFLLGFPLLFTLTLRSRIHKRFTSV